jgi:hypothetical protein
MAEASSQNEPVLSVDDPRETVTASSSGTTSPEPNTNTPGGTTDPNRRGDGGEPQVLSS